MILCILNTDNVRRSLKFELKVKYVCMKAHLINLWSRSVTALSSYSSTKITDHAQLEVAPEAVLYNQKCSQLKNLHSFVFVQSQTGQEKVSLPDTGLEIGGNKSKASLAFNVTKFFRASIGQYTGHQGQF